MTASRTATVVCQPLSSIESSRPARAVDLELLARLRRGEVVLRDGQLVDQDGNKVT